MQWVPLYASMHCKQALLLASAVDVAQPSLAAAAAAARCRGTRQQPRSKEQLADGLCDEGRAHGRARS